MNIIEIVQNALAEFPKISEVCNSIHIDFTEDEPTDYGLSPVGDSLISEDILGNQTRQHNFILYAVYQSQSDYDRLTNSGILLELQMWLEKYIENHSEIAVQTDGTVQAGTLTKLSCANGMLYEIPLENYNSAVRYQLQIYAQYKIKN